MAKLFLSYSRKDLSRIAPIIAGLKSAGHTIWVDVDDERAGEQWRKQIVEAIESSERFLLILSDSSITTGNVRRELDIAVDSDIPILPIDLDQINVPPEMKYQLAGIQRIDLSKDFETGLDSLLTLLENKKGAIQESTTVCDQNHHLTNAIPLTFADPIPEVTRQFVIGRWLVEQKIAGIEGGSFIDYLDNGNFSGRQETFMDGRGERLHVSGEWNFTKLAKDQFRMILKFDDGHQWQSTFSVVGHDRIHNMDENYDAVRVPN